MKTLTPINPPATDAAANPPDPQTADILARTIWGEARGEGTIGMQAVAAVVMNRLSIARTAGTYWWGTTAAAICRKPFQFSCWTATDPNFGPMQCVDASDLYFATALRLAQRALIGQLDDPTGGATHYCVAGLLPDWARGRTPVAAIGHHVFYRIVQ